MAGRFSRLTPPGVAAAEIVGSRTPASLMPQEEGVLGRVAETRRRDFTFGRQCARDALVQLGEPAQPILRGADRQPLWPAGIRGSITHCNGYCAAVVARASEVPAIGIDAERATRVHDGILDRIAIYPERRWLASAPSDGMWGALLFSAKESVFKAWFPLAATWLEFDEAHIDFQMDAGTFRATILPGAAGLRAGVPRDFRGRFQIDGEFVFTAAFI